MKKWTVLASLILFLGVAMSFLPGEDANIPIGERINFQTINGEFSDCAMPSKGRDINYIERRFESFKEKNPEHAELKLYRTTAKNYLKTNHWQYYREGEEWQYPLLIPVFSQWLYK